MEENKGQILLYQTPDGKSRIDVRLEGETVWLNLEQMAELFQRNKSTISRQIKNVFEEGVLNAIGQRRSDTQTMPQNYTEIFICAKKWPNSQIVHKKLTNSKIILAISWLFEF